MKEIAIDQVKKLWEEDTKDVCVYIHSPFCKKRCRYCAYKGQIITESLFQKYYYDYLPKQIAEYKEIMEKKNIISWFFGGGTATMMDAGTMRYIFSLLPEKFKISGEKVIEMHPAYGTEEQIDVMGEYNFDVIIFGVQTFNKEILKRENRDFVSPQRLGKLISYAKSKGLKIASDLIFFHDEGYEKILEKDLTTLDFLGVDEITVTTLSGPQKTPEKNEKVHQFVLEFTKNSNFTLMDMGRSLNVEKGIFKLFRKNKDDKKFFSYFAAGLIEPYSANIEGDASVLGIGEYKNHQRKTYSVIGDYISLAESNENWKPHYYIFNVYSFWDRVRALIDHLQKNIGEPPKRAVFSVRNSPNLFNEHDGSVKDIEDIITLPWEIPLDTPVTEYERAKQEKFREKAFDFLREDDSVWR